MRVTQEHLTIGGLVASAAGALEQAQQVAATLYLQPGKTAPRSKPILISRGSFEIPFAFVGKRESAGAQNIAEIPDIASSPLQIVISADALKRHDADQLLILHLAFEYADQGFVLASSAFTARMN